MASAQGKGPVRVEADDLILREFQRADREDLLAAFADEDIARWNPGPTGPDAVGDFMAGRNDWSAGSHASWAVADASDRLVGAVSVHKIDGDQADAEVGYWTAPWARRRGVAAGSLAAATRFAFAELGLHRVYLYHAVENPGSCRVARAAGFLLEGTLRHSYKYADGLHRDEHLHARLSTDAVVRRAPAEGPPASTTRLITLDDALRLAQLLQANRSFLAPWEPVRGDDYFTVDGQMADVRLALERHQQGSTLPHVIVDESGQVVGRVTLNGIVRGPFQSCSVGYWVSATANGRGIATAAVRDIKRLAFDELGLHRLEAGTLLHNVASQRVLERNGFARFGIAPAYLNIAGQWQDHALYQVVRTDPA
jgi:ribosomal-protein-alanine N-acetyltransferase